MWILCPGAWTAGYGVGGEGRVRVGPRPSPCAGLCSLLSLEPLAELWPWWSVFLPGSWPALAEGLLGPADYVSLLAVPPTRSEGKLSGAQALWTILVHVVSCGLLAEGLLTSLVLEVGSGPSGRTEGRN